MRKTAGGADEEHGGGNDGGEDHGVMAGSGEDGPGVDACSLGSLMKLQGEIAIHGDGTLLGLHDGVDATAAQSSGCFDLGEEMGDGGVARFVLWMTNVQRGDLHPKH